MGKVEALGRWQRFGLIAVVMVCVVFSHKSILYSAEPASATGAYALTKGDNEFGFWADGPPVSSKIIGNVDDRKLLMAALRYGQILAAWDSITLEYTLDILPAAVVFEPDHVRRGSSSIYGAGLFPLGFKLNFGQQSWIKPFVAASVGFLYFQYDIPVPHSARFNFTPEVS